MRPARTRASRGGGPRPGGRGLNGPARGGTRPGTEPRAPLRLGTAGWAIPRAQAAAFPAEGVGLARYAARFDAVEINSSFHRPHRPATYARWAATTPDGFRFAVKLPKTITHGRRLAETEDLLDAFLAEIAGLGAKLGPLLVQLPPSLALDPGVAARFFRQLGERTQAPIACEPRHPSWFTPEADDLLSAVRAARVAADPARVPAAAEPGGWPGLLYHRLHGAPAIYRSAYPEPALAGLAARLAQRLVETWCVFDNTASGAAAGNALALQGMVGD